MTRSMYADTAKLRAALVERDAFIVQLGRELQKLKRHVSRTPAGHDVLLSVEQSRKQWWRARYGMQR